MKIKSTKADKIETQMAPMIDVVFQLLIFFMLTLKIVEPEGDFTINMPLGKPTEQTDDIPLQDLKIKMLSDEAGGLRSLLYDSRDLLPEAQRAVENDPNLAATRENVERVAFKILNDKILTMTNKGQVKDQQVEIDADYKLRYEYGIQCIGACTGRMEEGQLVRFVEKIKFAKVRKPDA